MDNINKQIILANRIIDYIKENPMVKECKLHGSLSNGNFDKYSDIDIKVDVSGYVNAARYYRKEISCDIYSFCSWFAY